MKSIRYIFALLLLVFIASCENDNNAPINATIEQGNNNPFLANFGNAIQASFMGTVVNEDNNPISGVTINIGSKSVTTDVNGVFSITSATVFEKFAYVKASKDGFIDGSRSLTPSSTTVNYVKIMLLSLEPEGTITSGQELTFDFPNGGEVIFPGDFINQFGGPYQGEIDVVIKPLSVDDENMKLIMPGSLLAQNLDGSLRILETYGMLSVELRGQNGEELNIDPNNPVTIKFPVSSSINNPPATIPLWYFDEDNGYWKEEGSAELVDGKYVGTVSHFSFWNWDFQYPAVTVCVTLEDTNGNVLPHTPISLYSSALNSTGTYGYTDANGVECGLVPQDDTLTLSIPNFGCLGNTFTTTIGPFSADESVTITVQDTDALTTNFTAIFNDCNGNSITNGYLQLVYNNEAHTIPITSGTISQVINYCASNTTYSAQVIDLNNSQSTTVLNGNFTMPNTDLGTEMSCVDLLDTDNDGVLDINEDVNGDNDLNNDDTDNDGFPNYNDEDDDGDGINTIDEDYDNDGNPMNEDSDGDGIPDYLDGQDVISNNPEIFASNCDANNAQYNLTTATGSQNTTYSYFETQVDADNNTNPIANPSSYINTNMFDQVYYRATNTISNQSAVGEIALLGIQNFIDSDNDGLTDCEEITGLDNGQTSCNPNGNITDPNNADTDGDGYNDCQESAAGTDPNDASDFPNFSEGNIELVKTGAYVDSDGDGTISVGDIINYSFIITNTGNVNLTNIMVSDPLLVAPNGSITGGPITLLTAGSSDSSTFSGSYTIQQADIDSGSVTNSATVTGNNPAGDTVTDISDDPTDVTDVDTEGDGEPDDPTIIILQ